MLFFAGYGSRRAPGLRSETPDRVPWSDSMAAQQGCCSVSNDEDFRGLGLKKGAPLKEICLIVGNISEAEITRILMEAASFLQDVLVDPATELLTLRRASMALLGLRNEQEFCADDSISFSTSTSTSSGNGGRRQARAEQGRHQRHVAQRSSGELAGLQRPQQAGLAPLPTDACLNARRPARSPGARRSCRGRNCS